LIYLADCPLHLVIACVQAVGALYGVVLFSLLVLGYPQTAVWIHMLLPWACHLDPISIPPTCSGGYLNVIERVWTGPGSRREEFVYTTAGIYNGKDLHPSVLHHLLHRNIPQEIFEPLGITDLQTGLRAFYRYS
jgi:hypothetical protein